MNNNITHLTNGDFEVMPDDELTANESLYSVLVEIRKDAVKQYKIAESNNYAKYCLIVDIIKYIKGEK